MPETVQQPHDSAGSAFAAFLATLPPTAALRLRTLAHAWEGGGGRLHVGRLSIRLLAGSGAGAFTAGTLHARHGEPPVPTLELSRVLLQAHGVTPQAWTEWCDERPELRALGFDGEAKFPVARLEEVTDPMLARLAVGLRDLARLVSRPG